MKDLFHWYNFTEYIDFTEYEIITWMRMFWEKVCIVSENSDISLYVLLWLSGFLKS